MTRLIDADALMEAIENLGKGGMPIAISKNYIQEIVNDAPTVQREGWVSVPTEPAIEQFKDLGGNEEPEPIERLRLFCSLAMTNRNWLDVEPFFDDVITQLNTEKG